MAKEYEAPAGVNIAALKGAGKKSTALDLMKPGPGTPWEDRGAQGTPKAFIGTAVRSITAPALLLDHIRRPDTTHEASAFAYGCSAMWGISTALHMVIYNIMYPPAGKDEYYQGWDTQYYLKTAILSVIVAAGVYVLTVMFASRLYFALVSTELKNAAPRVLIHNMFCYALGPSILAPIPVIGPPLALVMIFVVWCVAGAKRLYITWRGSIVASVLAMAAAIIIGGAGFFVANTLLHGALMPSGPTDEERADREAYESWKKE